MDNNRFDNLTRYIGEQKTRRNMIKAAAGSTLAVLGMGAAAGSLSARTFLFSRPAIRMMPA